jgi:hypothetical protein
MDGPDQFTSGTFGSPASVLDRDRPFARDRLEVLQRCVLELLQDRLSDSDCGIINITITGHRNALLSWFSRLMFNRFRWDTPPGEQLQYGNALHTRSQYMG